MGVNNSPVFQRFLKGFTVGKPRAGNGGAGVILASSQETLALVYRPNLTVRDVCAEVAAGLGISPVALDFFTLVSEDHRHLLDPSKGLTESDCNSRYHFKLCFKACCAATLREFDRNAHDYYFHQCRNDFLEGRLQFGSDKRKKECLLKMVILEIIYKARLHEVNSKTVLNNPKTYGIQGLLNMGFLQTYPKKEKKVYFTKKISDFDHLEKGRIKVEYLCTAEKTVDFFVHKMNVTKLYQNGTNAKNAAAVNFEVYISPQFGIKKKKRDQEEDYPEEIVKEFEDVVSLDIEPVTGPNKLTISREGAEPEILYAESADAAHSLLTLVQGYYRLLVNRYKNLTRGETAAVAPGRLKVHGPVMRAHAEDLLDQAGRHDGLFLIRKNRDIHGAFVLSLCHDKKVTHHKVHCTNGELGLDAGPQFDDLQSLVEHYTQSKGGLRVALGRQCQPRSTGFDALLADQQQPPVPLTPRPERPARFFEVDFDELDITRNLEGEFGQVSGAVWRTRELEHLSVVLRKLQKPVLESEEEFYGMIKNSVEQLNEKILRVHGICSTPSALFLVTEFAPKGELDKFIAHESKSDNGITISRVVHFASQIAEGMLFLHTEGITHGRLSAHNVLVMDDDDVKISDVGLHQLALAGGRERATAVGFGYCWYSPLTLQSDTLDQANDIWAFGVTLWELLAMKRPFHRSQGPPLSKEEGVVGWYRACVSAVPAHTTALGLQVMRFYLRQQNLGPDRSNCPPPLAQLIRRCWRPKPEERPSFREIILDILKILSERAAAPGDKEDILIIPDDVVEAWDQEAPKVPLELQAHMHVNSAGKVEDTEYSCFTAAGNELMAGAAPNGGVAPGQLTVSLARALQQGGRPVGRVRSCVFTDIELQDASIPRCNSCPPNLVAKGRPRQGPSSGGPSPVCVSCASPVEAHDEYVVLQGEQSQRDGPVLLTPPSLRQRFSPADSDGVGRPSEDGSLEEEEEEERYVECPLGRSSDVKSQWDAPVFHAAGLEGTGDEDEAPATGGALYSSSPEDAAMMSLSQFQDTKPASAQPMAVSNDGINSKQAAVFTALSDELPDTSSPSPVASHQYVNQPVNTGVTDKEAVTTELGQQPIMQQSSEQATSKDLTFDVQSNNNFKGLPATVDQSDLHSIAGPPENDQLLPEASSEGEMESRGYLTTPFKSLPNEPDYTKEFGGFAQNAPRLTQQGQEAPPVCREMSVSSAGSESEREASISDADHEMRFLSRFIQGAPELPACVDTPGEAEVATAEQAPRLALPSESDDQDDDQEAAGNNVDHFLALLVEGSSGSSTPETMKRPLPKQGVIFKEGNGGTTEGKPQGTLGVVHFTPRPVEEQDGMLNDRADSGDIIPRGCPSHSSTSAHAPACDYSGHKSDAAASAMSSTGQPPEYTCHHDDDAQGYAVPVTSAQGDSAGQTNTTEYLSFPGGGVNSQSQLPIPSDDVAPPSYQAEVESIQVQCPFGLAGVTEGSVVAGNACAGSAQAADFFPFHSDGQEDSSSQIDEGFTDDPMEEPMAGLTLDSSAAFPAIPTLPPEVIQPTPRSHWEKCEIKSVKSDVVVFTKELPVVGELAKQDKQLFNLPDGYNGNPPADQENVPLQTFHTAQMQDPSNVEMKTSPAKPKACLQLGYQAMPPDVQHFLDLSSLPTKQQDDVAAIQRKISQFSIPSTPVSGPPVDQSTHFQLTPDDIPTDLRIKYRNLQFGRILGRGQFGEVRLGTIIATNRRGIEKREDVAVKVLKHTAREEDRNDFQKEARNMIRVAAGVENNFIIRLRGICYDEDNNQEMMLITELAPKGSLDKYLKNAKNKQHLSIGRLLLFSTQIAEGMAYLAAKDLVHRDLAARNILVAREDLVKISDFGLSRLYSYYKSKGNSLVPTRWYPPESLERGTFTSRSDVWSFGVTMWEMFSFGQRPYADLDPTCVLQHLKDGNRLPQPGGCPDKIYKVMKDCWKLDYQSRPTFFILHKVTLMGLRYEFPTCG